MFKFYNIDEDCVNYLQKIDKQVPNIHYRTNNKFVCGVVLEIKGIKFYAPISHITKKYQTSLVIYNGITPYLQFDFHL